MGKVIVTVTKNHYGEKMHLVGEKREVSEQTAAQLKRDGLADYAGAAAGAEKTEKIQVTDKKEKVEHNKNGTKK